MWSLVSTTIAMAELTSERYDSTRMSWSVISGRAIVSLELALAAPQQRAACAEGG